MLRRMIKEKNNYGLLYFITTITLLAVFQNITFFQNLVLTILRGTFLYLFYLLERKNDNLHIHGFMITSLLSFIFMHGNSTSAYPIIFAVLYRFFLLFYVISFIDCKKKSFLSVLFIGYFIGSLAILVYGLFSASDLFLGEHRAYMELCMLCIIISYAFMLLSLINLNVKYNRQNMLLFITCSLFVIADTVFGLIEIFDRSYYISLFTSVLYTSGQFLLVFVDAKYSE